MNYSQIYKQFIKSREYRVPDGYSEKHHILPRSLGGCDSEKNLILLSARDHFFAHMLLAKIHNGTMWHALNMMGSRLGILSSRRYAWARGNFAKSHSEHMKNLYANGYEPWNKGIKYTDEHREILSKAHTGKKLSPGHRQKVLKALSRRERDADWAANISKGLMGRTVPVNVRLKISETLQGNTPINKGVKDLKVDCPHCDKSGGRSIMKRWHFDRCKALQTK